MGNFKKYSQGVLVGVLCFQLGWPVQAFAKIDNSPTQSPAVASLMRDFGYFKENFEIAMMTGEAPSIVPSIRASAESLRGRFESLAPNSKEAKQLGIFTEKLVKIEQTEQQLYSCSKNDEATKAAFRKAMDVCVECGAEDESREPSIEALGKTADQIAAKMSTKTATTKPIVYADPNDQSAQEELANIARDKLLESFVTNRLAVRGLYLEVLPKDVDAALTRIGVSPKDFPKGPARERIKDLLAKLPKDKSELQRSMASLKANTAQDLKTISSLRSDVNRLGESVETFSDVFRNNWSLTRRLEVSRPAVSAQPFSFQPRQVSVLPLGALTQNSLTEIKSLPLSRGFSEHRIVIAPSDPVSQLLSPRMVGENFLQGPSTSGVTKLKDESGDNSELQLALIAALWKLDGRKVKGVPDWLYQPWNEAAQKAQIGSELTLQGVVEPRERERLLNQALGRNRQAKSKFDSLTGTPTQLVTNQLGKVWPTIKIESEDDGSVLIPVSEAPKYADRFVESLKATPGELDVDRLAELAKSRFMPIARQAGETLNFSEGSLVATRSRLGSTSLFQIPDEKVLDRSINEETRDLRKTFLRYLKEGESTGSGVDESTLMARIQDNDADLGRVIGELKKGFFERKELRGKADHEVTIGPEMSLQDRLRVIAQSPEFTGQIVQENPHLACVAGVQRDAFKTYLKDRADSDAAWGFWGKIFMVGGIALSLVGAAFSFGATLAATPALVAGLATAGTVTGYVGMTAGLGFSAVSGTRDAMNLAELSDQRVSRDLTLAANLDSDLNLNEIDSATSAAKWSLAMNAAGLATAGAMPFLPKGTGSAMAKAAIRNARIGRAQGVVFAGAGVGTASSTYFSEAADLANMRELLKFKDGAEKRALEEKIALQENKVADAQDGIWTAAVIGALGLGAGWAQDIGATKARAVLSVAQQKALGQVADILTNPRSEAVLDTKFVDDKDGGYFLVRDSQDPKAASVRYDVKSVKGVEAKRTARYLGLMLKRKQQSQVCKKTGISREFMEQLVKTIEDKYGPQVTDDFLAWAEKEGQVVFTRFKEWGIEEPCLSQARGIRSPVARVASCGPATGPGLALLDDSLDIRQSAASR